MSILSALWPPGMSGGSHEEQGGQEKGLAVDCNHHLLPTQRESAQRAELGLALHDKRAQGMPGSQHLPLDPDHKFPGTPSPQFAASA